MTCRVLIVLLACPFVLLASSPSDCASCHPHETQNFATSGMAVALQPGPSAPVLLANPVLSTKLPPYSYEIAKGIYSVSDGKETLRTPLNWAFGQGSTGQTYVFKRDGQWYESRVSFFPQTRGLDITLGAEDIRPANLAEAAGRLIAPAELNKCFGCHATNVSKTDPAGTGLIPGVQCERCHGSADAHLARGASMRSLGKFPTEETSDFCGQCHRTWSDISLNGPRGVRNVRFQPYRIATSKCYDHTDERIRCTACHDPHRARETVAAFYDAKCTACHARSATGTQASRHLCKTATKNCVSCHMPAIALPGSHKKFTDHRIRIARAGEPYPD